VGRIAGIRNGLRLHRPSSPEERHLRGLASTNPAGQARRRRDQRPGYARRRFSTPAADVGSIPTVSIEYLLA